MRKTQITAMGLVKSLSKSNGNRYNKGVHNVQVWA
jgi:hypothetical protein